MKYIIKNTFMDRTKTLKHRRAPGLQTEPVVGGKRLKLRSQVVLDEKAMRGSAELLKKLEKAGVIEIVPMDAPHIPVLKVEEAEVVVTAADDDTVVVEISIPVVKSEEGVVLEEVEVEEVTPGVIDMAPDGTLSMEIDPEDVVIETAIEAPPLPEPEAAPEEDSNEENVLEVAKVVVEKPKKKRRGRPPKKKD